MHCDNNWVAICITEQILEIYVTVLVEVTLAEGREEEDAIVSQKHQL